MVYIIRNGAEDDGGDGGNDESSESSPAHTKM